MGAIASLNTPALSVAPGDVVTSELRIANGGDVVDEFTVQPLGDGAEWIESEPPSVNLFPGADAIVTIRFAPPRAPSTTPGATPFALKVVSREDPDGSIVEEGTIDVGAFDERSIELHPATVTGRFGARYEIAVDNRGNQPIDVSLAGSDPQAACDFRFAHDVLHVEPGAAVFTKLRTRPRTRIWKGAPTTHQFQVLASNTVDPVADLRVDESEGDDGDDGSRSGASEAADVHVPLMTPGTYVQQPILPPWIVKAVLLAIVAIVALWVLWKTLLQPTVESTAREAVDEPITELEERVDDVEEAVETPPADLSTPPDAQPEGGGEEPALGGGEEPGGGGDAEGTDPVTEPPAGGEPEVAEFSTPFGDPLDFQLGAVVAPGATQDFVFDVTSEFSLTDLVIQNPRGDVGFVTVFRGADRIFVSALENFRDLDRHFVAPFVFNADQDLRMTVTCATPVDPAGCDVFASFAGFAK